MTTNISAIDLFNILRAKIGEQNLKALATKDDVHQVVKQVADLRVEVREQKADTIKWMFIFWIGQIGATIGVITLFLKK